MPVTTECGDDLARQIAHTVPPITVHADKASYSAYGNCHSQCISIEKGEAKNQKRNPFVGLVPPEETEISVRAGPSAPPYSLPKDLQGAIGMPASSSNTYFRSTLQHRQVMAKCAAKRTENRAAIWRTFFESSTDTSLFQLCIYAGGSAGYS